VGNVSNTIDVYLELRQQRAFAGALRDLAWRQGIPAMRRCRLWLRAPPPSPLVTQRTREREARSHQHGACAARCSRTQIVLRKRTYRRARQGPSIVSVRVAGDPGRWASRQWWASSHAVGDAH
jgi:hypothetical protein